MTEIIEAIFERWKTTMGHARAKLDAKRAKAIRAMLNIGYTQEDLELAIFGCSVSSFHQGQNDRGAKFDDINLICRDAEHVDRFIDLAEKAMAKQVRRAVESPRLLDRPATAVPDNLRKFVRAR
jgi:hypothetical protein